ncbi:MAG: integrase family protein [Microgenomates group bacterium GW2011_GWC1_37_8]|uniref:Tyrosine recombinase XerD subunit n=1 Tax=Candidatus Woesebacteria bacterium GW2011_GWB1_38_8 TaxID=1618570 RepID=A0A0G0L4G8_9BACT|nr:MAG: integrase family protein [Microgenomates group bacterium GW2011_GWC1_37_8]KKQ85917.1 MAG: Tyrosine recombinase XerD subunit [Candidatus Woesebacteria bacterium GW2011_GWB1_38_8]
MSAAIHEQTSEIRKKIDEFLEYLEVEKGSSPLTIRNYKHYLTRFVDWLIKEGIRLELRDINPEVVRQYRVYLSRISIPYAKGQARSLLTRKTQGYHVIALRSFLRFLIKNDYKVMSPDKIELPKIEERQVKFLTGDQVDRLLNAPSLSTIQGKRDKSILEVLFSTGLRVSELAKLDRDKVDLDRREFGIVGKGGKARVVFLSQRAVKWLDEYQKAREDKYKPLFIRHKGKVDPTASDEKMRLTVRTIQRIIKKYGEKMKLPVEVTPHVLRHSFATDLLMAGADLRSVQEMLGHKNVSTTQIYTHVTHKHLKDIHEAFHSKGNK